jgi:hypothetical protein
MCLFHIQKGILVVSGPTLKNEEETLGYQFFMLTHKIVKKLFMYVVQCSDPYVGVLMTF